MATITWKGEGPNGPPSIEWRGITFPVGEPVEVDNPWLVAKAKGNPFFEVEGDIPTGDPPTPEPYLGPDPDAPHHEPVDVEEDDDDKPHNKARRKHR